MPVQGLWNVGGVNLPDFGISEMLGIGPNNSAVALGGQANPLQTNTTIPIGPGGAPVPTYATAAQPSNYYNVPGPTQSIQQPQQQSTSSGPGGANPTKPDLGGYKGSGMDQGAYELAKARSDEAAQAGQVNDAYQPQINYLNDLLGQLNTSQTSQLNDKQDQYTRLVNQIPAEQQSQQQSIDEKLRSAFDQAVRSYNATKQQGQNRFGGGSSAGGAVSELAAQEFARQQGQLGQVGTQATAQLGQYVTQKKDQLLSWLQDTRQHINDNFQSRIAEVQNNRMLTEQQKTKDKLGILQNTIAQSRQIEEANRQFQQQIGLFAAQQLAQVTGQQFTPGQLNSYIQQFMNGPQIAQNQAPTSTNPLTSAIGSVGQKKDEFGNLIG